MSSGPGVIRLILNQDWMVNEETLKMYPQVDFSPDDTPGVWNILHYIFIMQIENTKEYA